MADPQATKDKESSIAALIACQPRIDSTENPSIAATYIYFACKSANSMGELEAPKIKTVTIDKLVSMGARVDFIEDANDNAEFIQSLFEDTTGSSAASRPGRRADSHKNVADITHSLSSKSAQPTAQPHAAKQEETGISSATSPSTSNKYATPPRSAKQHAAVSSAPASTDFPSILAQIAALYGSRKQQNTPPFSTSTQTTEPPQAGTPSSATTQSTNASHAAQRKNAGPSSTPTPPGVTPCSAKQASPRPNSQVPTYTPVLDERLPQKLKSYVDQYRKTGWVFLDLLLEYGTFRSGDETDRTLYYTNVKGDWKPITVKTKEIYERNGKKVDIPYILGGQYLELVHSIRNLYGTEREELRKIRELLLDPLHDAIAGRSTVHDWHLRLPEADYRVTNNSKHAAFLQKLVVLRNNLSIPG